LFVSNTKKNIQTYLNTKYLITVKFLFLFELELLSQKCVIILKLHQKPYFRLEALWHSSKFRSTDNHSGGSSEPLTWFVITCLINRTLSQKQNSTAKVLGNPNGGRKTCSEFNTQLKKGFWKSHSV